MGNLIFAQRTTLNIWKSLMKITLKYRKDIKIIPFLYRYRHMIKKRYWVLRPFLKMHYQTDSLIELWQVLYHCDDRTYIIKTWENCLLHSSFNLIYSRHDIECSTAIFTFTTIYFYPRQYLYLIYFIHGYGSKGSLVQ